MDGEPGDSPDAHWKGRARPFREGAAVRLTLLDGGIELRFERGFTPADVQAVKAIPGRRWQARRLVWLLPDSPKTREALVRAFAERLVGWPEGREPPEASRSAAKPRSPATTPPPRDSSDAPGMHPDGVLDALRREIELRGYSQKTERAYTGWARRFLAFHSNVASGGIDRLREGHVRAFLEHLAGTERLAARSRNQAASALAFLFREVLGRDELLEIPRAKGPTRLPPVLSHREVLRVLRELTGKYFLVVVLLYSAGLRIEECLRMRVKDIDFELRQILVRDGKGRKDRYVPLARRATDLLRAQIGRVGEQHERDRAEGHGWAALPGALHRKDPQAGFELNWQCVFPASTMNEDPATGRRGRGPLHPSAIQREVKRAVRRSGIPKRATCHTFRHSFATEALRGGCDIRTLQHVMGHRDIRTTMIYLHVVEQTGLHIRSPLDRPDDADEYDVDLVARPWSGADTAWNLAATQWEPGGRGRPK